MKRIFSIVLCAVMMSFTVTAGAYREADGYKYNVISDIIEIVGISSGSELEQAQTVTLPYSIRGMAVRKIGASAFRNNNIIQRMEIHDNILEIGNDAMYSMKSLKEITIPLRLTILGDSAFAQCSSLETVNFRTESLIRIEDRTFYGCTKLNDVILPENLTEIGEYAFAQCMSLDRIYIPSSVLQIEDTGFLSVKRGFTIYGYKSSAAYDYASKNGVNFVDISEKKLDELTQSIATVTSWQRTADSSLYTEETITALSTAYANAVEVKENFFSTPIEVETATETLNNALYSLRLKSMDTLDELIIQAENEMENSFCYTENSANALEEAINQAKNIQNAVLPSVTQVQNVINNLNSNLNGLTEVVKYDVNFDGRISLADIVTVHKKLISDEIFTQRDIYIADFNSDNQITLSDIVLFQRHLLTR